MTGWMSRSSCERDWARISPAMYGGHGRTDGRRSSLGMQTNKSGWRTQDDHACRPISALLVLCPTELNHIFCRRVSDVDLAKNRISVICETEEKEKLGEVPSIVSRTSTHMMPPMGSRIIFSMALGPRHVRITSATV